MSVYFDLDSTTMNDVRLLLQIHNPETVNTSAGHCVSYGNFFFCISRSYGRESVLPVEFKGLF